MIDAEQVVANLSQIEQWRRAIDLANIVAPYGYLDADVIGPGVFGQLLGSLNAAGVDGRDLAPSVETSCGEVVERFDDEPDEPDGPGFYALGAVVSVFYASRALNGDADGGLNSVKRFLDLVGAADDDGQIGMLDAAVGYLAMPSTIARGGLADRVSTHAASMH